jgi:ornithine cyclodeaminase
MASFASRMYRSLSVPVRMAGSVEEAVADADLVVAITDAQEPLLFPGMVGPGCHLTSVGADVAGHRELSATLIRQSSFFCDDRRRALAPHALPALGLGEEAIAGELSEVVAGLHPGRRDPDEVTLFAAYGLPHQLLAGAWLVYLGALEDPGLSPA